MARLTIALELTSTLELEALESALEMFEAYADEMIKNPQAAGVKNPRDLLVCKAGVQLLGRIRNTGGVS